MIFFFRDFSWSPSDNYLAYWVPEQNNIPARVTIISMPGRTEMCVRNLFNVADCRMHWQKNGDFLCVKVDRYSKARKAEDTGQWKYSVCLFLCLVLKCILNQSYDSSQYLGLTCDIVTVGHFISVVSSIRHRNI